METINSSIELELAVFSLEAIRRACYEMAEICAFEIRTTQTATVIVSVQGRTIPGDFRRTVLDHQVRIDTEARFGTIRELIVAQAFAPCDNLPEVVARCVP